jgi:DNA-binding MarR family transcriptional regulator
MSRVPDSRPRDPRHHSRQGDIAALDAALTRIGRAANSRRAARRRAELSGVDLLPTGVGALAAVFRLGPVRLTDVALHVDLEPSRVSKEINRLVEAGLVAPETDPSDGRAVLLSVTDQGADAFRRYRETVDRQLSALLRDWSDSDVRQLAALLGRLAAAVHREPEGET